MLTRLGGGRVLRAWVQPGFRQGLTAVAVLLALLVLGVGPPDGRDTREIALPPGGLVERGRPVTLAVDGALRASQVYRLTIGCTAGPACARLRLGVGPGAPDRPPDGFDKGRPHFDLAPGALGAGPLRLGNDGDVAVRVTRTTLRTHVAGSDRPPRFNVFLEGPHQRYPLYTAGGLLVAGVALQIAGLVAWAPVTARRAHWVAWGVVLPPLAALPPALMLRAGGYRLALPWDGLLVLCGLAVIARALAVAPAQAPLAAAWLRRLRPGRLMARVAEAVLAPLPACFPGLVLLVYLPLSIYLPNQADFNFNLWTLLPFGVAMVVWLILAVAVAFWRSPARDRVVSLLFLLGLLVLVLDLVTPVHVDLLDGRPVTELLHVPPLAPWIQGLVLVVFVLFGATVRWVNIRFLAQVVALALLAFEGYTLATRLAAETNYSAWAGTGEAWSHPPPATAATSGNVYHLILDGFSSPVFLDSLRAASLEPSFEGFTYFANARANMLETIESMPSFMTGTFFPPKLPQNTDEAWWDYQVGRWRRLCRREGMLEHAYRQGYTITQYVPRLKWCPHVRTTQFRVGADLQLTNKRLAAFADLWLFRLAPAPWKALVFGQDNRGVLERTLRQPSDIEWGYWSITHMAQLVEDEEARPAHGQYVWAHFGTPHFPSVVDADCNYVGTRWHGNAAGGYADQATCALRLAAQLVETLKRRGRFDAATIVIQSDHGMGWVDASSDVNRMPTWLEEKLDTEARRSGRGRWINNRSLALLLIKPPGAPPKPLRVDQRLVSLVDLPQTLYELHGWPVRSPEGRSVFAGDAAERREAHLFVHFRGEYSEPGVKRDWHLVFDGAGWRIAPDYPERIP